MKNPTHRVRGVSGLLNLTVTGPKKLIGSRPIVISVLSAALMLAASYRSTVTLAASNSSKDASLSAAVASSTWNSTGSLATARSGSSASLLHNGSVLVAGGNDPNSVTQAGLSSAEIYKPATGTWSPTGSMNVARFSAASTVLMDGKVLVAGGANGGDPGSTLSSAELYDPATGTWSLTGSMTTPRSGATATLLQNGSVLVVGGTNAGSGSPGLAELSSAEIYNPSLGTWSPTGSLTTPQSPDTATLLKDGDVLVAGGISDTGAVGIPYLSSAELYDPATGTWSQTGSMTTPRAGATATLLKTGEVLVAGGDMGGYADNTGTEVASAELYDPATGTWSSTGSMTTPRSGASASLIKSGSVLVAGGFSPASPNSAVVASAELYDPASGTWSSAGSMTTPRSGASATLLSTGDVLVAGGEGTSSLLSSAELYIPTTYLPFSVTTYPTTAVVNLPIKGTVGVISFTGPSATSTPAAIFSAQINWGNGSTSTGIVAPLGAQGDQATFSISVKGKVFGSPIANGMFTISVTMTGVRVSASAPLNVLTADPQANFIINPTPGTQNQVSLLMPGGAVPKQQPPIVSYHWHFLDGTQDVNDNQGTHHLYEQILQQLAANPSSPFLEPIAISLGILPPSATNRNWGSEW